MPDTPDLPEPTLDDLPSGLQLLISDLLDLVADVTGQLAMSLAYVFEWQNEMERLLTRYHLSAYMTGQGSQVVTPKDMRTVSGLVKSQLEYLDNFATAIQEADEFQNGWNTRAAMYAESIKVPYWKGATKVLPLPAMPAQGTQCLTNCKCKWEIVVIDEEKESWDCYWRRGASDSCQTCIQRAMDWNPLRIRGGSLILDDFEDETKEYIDEDLEETTEKHMKGKHNQASHGRSTGRRSAYINGYRAARAGGASVSEARGIAKQASGSYQEVGDMPDNERKEMEDFLSSIEEKHKRISALKAEGDKDQDDLMKSLNKMQKLNLARKKTASDLAAAQAETDRLRDKAYANGTDKDWAAYSKSGDRLNAIAQKDETAQAAYRKQVDIQNQKQLKTIERYNKRQVELSKLEEDYGNMILGRVGQGGSRANFSVKMNVSDEYMRQNINRGVEGFRNLVSDRVMPSSIVVGINQINGRSHALGDKNVINIGDASPRVVVHELAHRLEMNNPRILQASREFITRRTEGESWVKMSEVTRNPNYRDDEFTKPDKFIDPYVGKYYRDATEVISMGLENMYANPISFYRNDPEHFTLTYRAMKGLL